MLFSSSKLLQGVWQQMNLPNWLSAIRMFTVIPVAYLLTLPDWWAPWVAFATFVLAGLTDFLDGWAARYFDQVTSLGRVADPLADKVMICPLLFYASYHHESWLLLVTAMVTVGYDADNTIKRWSEIRLAFLGQEQAGQSNHPVTWFSKRKTAVQFGALGFLFAPIELWNLFLLGSLFEWATPFFGTFCLVFVLISWGYNRQDWVIESLSLRREEMPHKERRRG